MFRFAIMGAGKIAPSFCEAVHCIPDCEICAVASQSMDRATNLADTYGITHAYDDYEIMLEDEHPDCVYIAVTPNAHFALTMLCIRHGIPVLCEKAMFLCAKEAKEAFSEAKRRGVFVMEAMWSRFLPSNVQARKWIQEGVIGKVNGIDIALGFVAPPANSNRYRSQALGGGVATDLTVYAYELATWIMGKKEESFYVDALWGETGVDMADHVMLHYADAMVSLKTSFLAPVDERMVVYGEKGRIVVPTPHHSYEAWLFDCGGRCIEHYTDNVTTFGFVYEANEVMRCIREGVLESPVVPHKDTIQCARLFDAIAATKQ